MKIIKEKYTLFLFMLMLLVPLIVAGISIAFIYKVNLNEKKDRLKIMGEYQKKFIRLMYKETNDENKIIHILDNQNDNTGELFKTSEIVIARIEKDSIKFVTRRDQRDFRHPETMSFKNDFGLPIKYALANNKGFITGKDYNKLMVLAYVTYIPELKWGLVAKMNMNVVNEPFYRASKYAVISAIILSLISIFLFYKFREKSEKIKNQFIAIIQNTDESIISEDLQGIILTWNKGAEKIYGYTAREIIGHDVSLLIPKGNPNHVLNIINRIHNGEIIERYETTRTRKDGTVFPVSINYSAIRNANGRMIGISIMSHDITERKKNEELLMKSTAELNELVLSKNKILRTVTHDLKNSISGLFSGSKILAENIHSYSKDEILNLSNIIYSSALKNVDLINNLETWAKAQSGSLTPQPVKISLVDVVNHNIVSLKTNAFNKEITLRSSVQLDLFVKADINMLSTVIYNLLNNALKFTRKGGEVTVDAARIKGHVLVIVKDDGIGISKDGLGKIFRIDEKYTNTGTNGETGTGWGLLISKEFIEKQGGRIWVESEQGNGSEFKFTIPVA